MKRERGGGRVVALSPKAMKLLLEMTQDGGVWRGGKNELKGQLTNGAPP